MDVRLTISDTTNRKVWKLTLRICAHWSLANALCLCYVYLIYSSNYSAATDHIT